MKIRNSQNLHTWHKSYFCNFFSGTPSPEFWSIQVGLGFHGSLSICEMLLFIIRLEIANYCSRSVPTLSNAISPSPNELYICASTSYACNAGYTSSGSVDPFITCEPFNASTGQWDLTYDCQSMSRREGRFHPHELMRNSIDIRKCRN